MQSLAPPATPAAVARYCAAGHTNAQAARHFGLNERTVRKLKAKARNGPTRQQPGTDPAPIRHRARIYDLPERPPVMHRISPNLVARDGVLWKCPTCGELMPPLPGTSWEAWQERGCYLCGGPEPGITSRSSDDGDRKETMLALQSQDPPESDNRPGPLSESANGRAPGAGPAPSPSASQSARPAEPAPAPGYSRSAIPARPRPPGHAYTRISEPAPLGGLVGWALANPMIGPAPLATWLLGAALLLAVAALA
jgi:hypothetical protein